MAIDTRDWYIARLRKRLGFRERARFRVNLGQEQRRRGWLFFAKLIGGMLAAWIVLLFAVRALTR